MALPFLIQSHFLAKYPHKATYSPPLSVYNFLITASNCFSKNVLKCMTFSLTSEFLLDDICSQLGTVLIYEGDKIFPASQTPCWEWSTYIR